MRANLHTPREHLTSIEVNGTFYRTHEARELPQMGIRSAGRLRVLAERPALRGQSPRAGGSRRTRSSASSIPASPNWATTSAPCSGNSRRPRNSTRPISAKFLELLPKTFDGHRCGTSSRSATTVSRRPRSSRLLRQFAIADRVTPSTRPIRASPTSPAISSMRGCRKAMRNSKPAIRPKRSMPGPKRAQVLGAGRRARRPATHRQTARNEKAARRLRLFHPRSQGARAGGRHGALIERLYRPKLGAKNENDHRRKGAVTSGVARLVVAAGRTRVSSLPLRHLRRIYSGFVSIL